MSKTRRLDALRNILKNKASYFSVMLIAFLGVAAFLSMDYSAWSLRHAGSDAYNEMNFRDLEIISPLMLGRDDFEAIRNTEGVADAEAVLFTGANIFHTDRNRSVNVISLTERISKAVVQEGKRPEKKNECAVEGRLATEMGLKVGDRIKILSQDGGEHACFKEEEYLVTGILLHPDHINPTSSVQPYVMTAYEAFDTASFGDSITAVDVVIDKNPDEYRFGSSYDSAVRSVSEKLKALADKRYGASYETVLQSLKDSVSEYKKNAEEKGLIPGNVSDAELEAALRVLAEKDKIPEEYSAILKEYLEESDRLKTLKDASWIVNDVSGNNDYASLIIDGENIEKLEMTFSLMFIFVGALVIYATIGKMIDEQREQVGGMKAFGLLDREIYFKYLVFGVSAALTGIVLGILSARFIFSGYVLSSYGRYYSFDINKPRLAVFPTVTVTLTGIILSVGSCFFACRRLLCLSAFSLMQPRVPRIIIKEKKGKKSVLGLYGRLILRNMRTDVKRIAVTVASVAGCCALIVTGFTLRSAVGGCLKKQYTEVTRYDEKISFNTPGAGEKIEELLKEKGASYIPVYESFITYRMGKNTLGRLLCSEPEEFDTYLNIRDWKSGAKLPLEEKGIFIPRRIAEIYELNCGDEVEITTWDFQTGRAVVAGIFENYIGSDVYMNVSYFKSLFPGDCSFNEYLVKLNGSSEKELAEALNNIDGFETMKPADSEKSMFESATSVVNAVILMLVFMAAMMAAVVLSNLTNMYMLQKKRELTIMRINGFSVKETIGYMIRDTIMTTLAGIILGLATGSFCAYHIVRSLEQPYTRMERGVSFSAWILAAAITVLFTTLVNLLVLKKVKNLRLSDI